MESSEFKIIYELKNLQKNENIVKIIQGFDENENEIEVSFNGDLERFKNYGEFEKHEKMLQNEIEEIIDTYFEKNEIKKVSTDED